MLKNNKSSMQLEIKYGIEREFCFFKIIVYPNKIIYSVLNSG
jgi:hypothetical protein